MTAESGEGDRVGGDLRLSYNFVTGSSDLKDYTLLCVAGSFVELACKQFLWHSRSSRENEKEVSCLVWLGSAGQRHRCLRVANLRGDSELVPVYVLARTLRFLYEVLT